MPLPRYGHRALLLKNGKVLVTGGTVLKWVNIGRQGYFAEAPATSADVYDPNGAPR